VLRLSPATASCTNLVQENQFSSSQQAHFDFFTINFTVQGHPLSTGGDALKYASLAQHNCAVCRAGKRPINAVHVEKKCNQFDPTTD
jgi:hypothetical protein